MSEMIDETNPDAEIQETITDLRAAGTQLATFANADTKPGNLAAYESILKDLLIQVAGLQASLIEPDFDVELKKELINDARNNIGRVEAFLKDSDRATKY
jgi:hypothetical protein